ncbi:hypothetical protein GOP47_0009844 [Adiantum capillus-veneris]|uniref:Exocyst subunit Exo70 family protein n=1 Tax=Adiantum capillus-veneris TaxID=13818 RepID=A0A9D4UY81_ADICA|nr:hypothetical protein GOP47_0009844 [Adiantum capillus-veneris]
MVEDTAASLQRCTLHQQKLLAARSNLAKRLGELSHIQGKLHDAESKLLDLDQKLPLLYDAMAPIRSRAAYASGLASRVDSALDHASAVLDIFKSIQTTERKLRNEDPRHDLRKYLAMVCCMERYLHMLPDAYGPSLHGLEGVIGFLNQSRALDRYSLSKLRNELEQSKSLDPCAELMSMNDGGLLSIPLRKLENEFGRLLVENCTVVDLSAYLNSSDVANSPEASVAALPVVALIKQDAIIQLLVIADRLRVNGRLDECLHLYREARGRMVKKSMATLKPEYLRHASAEALRDQKWEDIHRFLYAWLQDFTAVVRVLMASERELCNQVFPTLDPPLERTRLFEEIVQESKFSLFPRFAEEVACTQHRPEALLVGLLDLINGVGNLKDDIAKVFDGCAETLADLASLQRTLVHNTCRAYWELVKNVETRQSDVPNDGGKDRNASFVVNYMGMLLRDYPVTMELAFSSQYSSKKAGAIVEATLPSAASSIMDALEKSLEDRAPKGYNDPILAHVFLMNNYRHVLVRLKECDGLAKCLGEEFKVQWRKKVDHNMRSYLKKAWEKVMMHLSREGLQMSSGGRGMSKDMLRSRLRAFNASFEETYKQQCRWVILDDQLRDSVQLAIIQLLVPAYHSFIQSFGSLLEEGTHPHKRVVKYSGDRLQSMVRDLFEGKQPHFSTSE